MENKDKIKVLFDTDANGYILGYQNEFFDGSNWVVPFDTSKAIDISPSDLSNIHLGASKISSDGTFTLDEEKDKELIAEQEKAINLTPEKQLEDLQAKNDKLSAALLELSDLVLNNSSTN